MRLYLDRQDIEDLNRLKPNPIPGVCNMFGHLKGVVFLSVIFGLAGCAGCAASAHTVPNDLIH